MNVIKSLANVERERQSLSHLSIFGFIRLSFVYDYIGVCGYTHTHFLRIHSLIGIHSRSLLSSNGGFLANWGAIRFTTVARFRRLFSHRLRRVIDVVALCECMCVAL